MRNIILDEKQMLAGLHEIIASRRQCLHVYGKHDCVCYPTSFSINFGRVVKSDIICGKRLRDRTTLCSRGRHLRSNYHIYLRLVDCAADKGSSPGLN